MYANLMREIGGDDCRNKTILVLIHACNLFTEKVAKDGEGMIEDTIRAVREAESEAERIVQNAKHRAEDILKESEAQKTELLQNARLAAAELRAKVLDDANAEGIAKLADTDQASEIEVSRLKEAAGDAWDDAVAAVIDEVLQM